jgi:hypothetical protein
MRKMELSKYCFAIFSSCLFATTSYAATTAPVTGFARDFLTGKPIPDADITVLENGLKIKSNDQGLFGPLEWPVGKTITLVIEKTGYQTTQSATITVPAEGLNTPYNNISLQPFDVFTYNMFALAMGIKIDNEKCHVGTTVTAYHKNLNDLPQGERQAKILLTPNTSEIPFYFGIFTDGPLKDNPNPFARGLTETTDDGGVVFGNLEPSDEPYTMTAVKSGVNFTQVKFLCRKGIFINISPPQGPTVIL